MQQVIIATGPSFSGSPKDVDYTGVNNIASRFSHLCKKNEIICEKVVHSFKAGDLKWERLDDVIMGGNSKSQVESLGDGTIRFEKNNSLILATHFLIFFFLG